MNMLLPAPQPVKRTSPAIWAVVGIVALLGLSAMVWVGSFVWGGFNAFTTQAHVAIRADPALAKAVGDITDISLDFDATGNAPGAEEFAYRIKGTRASGLLVGRFITIDADHEELRDGSLTLEGGQVVRIGTSVQNKSSDVDAIAIPQTQ